MTDLTHVLVKRFEDVSADSFNRGVDWYDEANEFAHSIKGGFTVEHSASVISHLSPRTNWKKNKQAAAMLMAGDQNVGLFYACVNRALMALDTNEPLNTFGKDAHKTRSFVNNILGNTDFVTIDTWMLNITHPHLTKKEANNLLKRKGEYDSISNSFRYAAKYVDLNPAQLQAILWVDIRGKED